MSWNDLGVIEACRQVLAAGGIVLHPTETCYGLAVDVFNGQSLERLYHLKQMGRDKPVSILVSDLAMAEEYGDLSSKARELAEKYWPGPLALVVARTEKLPKFLNEGEETVSLRCSSMDFCRQMVAAFGQPVTTTSANVTGEPQAYAVNDLSDEFLAGVDLVIDGGMLPMASPSTIAKVVGEEVEVLREGDLKL